MFPNEESLERLIGATLTDHNESISPKWRMFRKAAYLQHNQTSEPVNTNLFGGAVCPLTDFSDVLPDVQIFFRLAFHFGTVIKTMTVISLKNNHHLS